MPTDTAPPATAPREQVHELQIAGAADRRRGLTQVTPGEAVVVVVLCSDQATQPVVNAGTLYQ